MPKRLELTGFRFGRLTVLGLDSIRLKSKLSSCSYWKCICDCGNEKITCVDSLRCGDTKSCGCIRKEGLVAMSTKHGLRYVPEYQSWKSMKNRCFSPNNTNFKNYGGRGITVCERWRNSLADFLSDMGPRPSPKHSIDRFPNNDGDYEPGNCRWATAKQQANNKRRSPT